MKILIACESSGRVRDAFIAHGHDAMSCDLLPTERPGPHSIEPETEGNNMQKSEELKDPASCLNKARDDEPIFVLRGIDPAAPAAVEAWCRERIALGINEPGDAKLENAEAWVNTVMNPELLYKIASGKIIRALGFMYTRFTLAGYEELHYEPEEDASIVITLLYECEDNKRRFYVAVGWRNDEIGIELGEDGDLYDIQEQLLPELLMDYMLEGVNSEYPFGVPLNDGRGDT